MCLHHLIAATILATSLLITPAMAIPKEDVEKLMNELLPFAEKMLREHGEFYPYGGALSADGKIVHKGADTGSQHPESTELINLMIQGFRSDAAQRKYIATAIIHDIRTIPPGQTQKTDAICVSLDHKDNYSVNVIFPYTLREGGKLSISTPFATKGDGKIFPAR